MSDYTPLREPGGDTPVYSVDFSVESAREVLREQQAANIHSTFAVLRAATQLETALRQLLASLDADGQKR
ncbi:hypothetical protein OG730_34860 [Streptomyces sp. NBC_01298]|uniref:hypothetical protein n=1 Tax=Streptomyces sp. NBC_01298 TaxID=2903817 RepID=UPI002E144E7C|nr:hypothetical protein OG730_34860 [Streptomyces sp. NBC_01298]